jgi:hypothetical protein
LLLRLRGGGGRSRWRGSGGAEQELGDDGVEEMVGCGGAGRGWGWSRSRSQHGVIARGRDRRGVVARRRCVSAVAAVAAVAGRRGGVGAGVTAHFRVIWWGFSARGDRRRSGSAHRKGDAFWWSGCRGAHVPPAVTCLRRAAPRRATPWHDSGSCVRRFLVSMTSGACAPSSDSEPVGRGCGYCSGAGLLTVCGGGCDGGKQQTESP